MVRTKPDSANHQNDLDDDETTIPPLDIMVKTRPNKEHHEDNYTQRKHKGKLTQIQKQHIHNSKEISSHLGHSKTAYRNFSTISIDKKSANASWLKLPSVNTLPHSYVLVDERKNQSLPVIIY
ncbi:hypothetical protein O181_045689 [Austropuccinia psidii MF-1]|uniref:Uncharacterized protein n=1 Tax=Austropuccinia psidii MF-1 TaxID=1389203 RepID=A0A9Q3HKL0_9BASI|nr:hypothetical protein [Austropuccinia psidii MF-1]